MATLRQKEAALLRAYQALMAARHALEPTVASMIGKTLRNRKSRKLYRVVGHGDPWHMMTVAEIGLPKYAHVPTWMANPSEFTIVGELDEKIPEEIPGKFDENPPAPVFRARRARHQ